MFSLSSNQAPEQNEDKNSDEVVSLLENNQSNVLKEVIYQCDCRDYQEMNSISQHVVADQFLNFHMS